MKYSLKRWGIIMKKSDITGWKDVFSFTLSQTLKSKSFIIISIITLLIIFISMPLLNRFTNKDEVNLDEAISIEKVYVANETSLADMDFTGMKEHESVKHIEFEIIEDNFDAVSDKIQEEENLSVILTMTEDEGMYSLDFLKSGEGSVKDQDLQQLGDFIYEEFNTFRINTMEISQDALDMLHAEVEISVAYSDEDGSPVAEEDTSISDNEYWFIYILLFIVMMVNVMGGAQIAGSIIVEKSSRVVENLLISIRPLALIIGKVLAMLTVVIGQTASYAIVFAVSNKLTSSGGKEGSMLATLLPEAVFSNLNIGNIILCFIVTILGFIFYGILAGLTGATVSKVEDVSSGMTLFYICIFIGLYLSIFAAGSMMGSGMNGLATFAYIFPLSSPYILPGVILIGEVTLPLLLISLGLLLLSLVLLFKFTANVYETLILHNGNPIKPKELFKLSRRV